MILARNFLSFHSIFRLFQKAHHSLQGSLPASEVLLPEPGTDMGKGSVQAEVPKGRALPPQLPAQSLFGTRLVLPALMLVLSESRAGMRRALPGPLAGPVVAAPGQPRAGNHRAAMLWKILVRCSWLTSASRCCIFPASGRMRKVGPRPR